MVFWFSLLQSIAAFGLTCPSGSQIKRTELGSKWFRETCWSTDLSPTAILPEVVYYSNGAKMSEGHVTNSRPVGKWQNWTANGELFKEVDYDSSGQEICTPTRPVLTEESIVGYAKGKIFYPLIVVKKDRISAFYRRQCPKTALLKDALSNQTYSAKFNPPSRDAHTDACIFSANLDAPPPDFRLLIWGPAINLRAPTKDEQADFAKRKTDCVSRTDGANDGESKCAQAKLVGVTAIGKSKKKTALVYRSLYLRRWLCRRRI